MRRWPLLVIGMLIALASCGGTVGHLAGSAGFRATAAPRAGPIATPSAAAAPPTPAPPTPAPAATPPAPGRFPPAITFADPSHGWAAIGRTILATTDSVGADPTQVVRAFLAAVQRDPSAAAVAPYVDAGLRRALAAGLSLTTLLAIPGPYRSFTVSDYGPAGTAAGHIVLLATLAEQSGPAGRNILLTNCDGDWRISAVGRGDDGPVATSFVSIPDGGADWGPCSLSDTGAGGAARP